MQKDRSLLSHALHPQGGDSREQWFPTASSFPGTEPGAGYIFLLIRPGWNPPQGREGLQLSTSQQGHQPGSQLLLPVRSGGWRDRATPLSRDMALLAEGVSRSGALGWPGNWMTSVLIRGTRGGGGTACVTRQRRLELWYTVPQRLRDKHREVLSTHGWNVQLPELGEATQLPQVTAAPGDLPPLYPLPSVQEGAHFLQSWLQTMKMWGMK